MLLSWATSTTITSSTSSMIGMALGGQPYTIHFFLGAPKTDDLAASKSLAAHIRGSGGLHGVQVQAVQARVNTQSGGETGILAFPRHAGSVFTFSCLMVVPRKKKEKKARKSRGAPTASSSMMTGCYHAPRCP